MGLKERIDARVKRRLFWILTVSVAILVLTTIARLEMPIGITIPVAAVRYYVEIKNSSSTELMVVMSHLNDIRQSTYSAPQEYSRRVRGWVRRREKVLLPGESWLAGLPSENETQKGVVQITACTPFIVNDDQKCAIFFVPWSSAQYIGTNDRGERQFPILEIKQQDLIPIELDKISRKIEK